MSSVRSGAGAAGFPHPAAAAEAAEAENVHVDLMEQDTLTTELVQADPPETRLDAPSAPIAVVDTVLDMLSAHSWRDDVSHFFDTINRKAMCKCVYFGHSSSFHFMPTPGCVRRH